MMHKGLRQWLYGQRNAQRLVSWLSTFSLSMLCVSMLSLSTSVWAAAKPNVLLIVLDDAGYSDVAGFGRGDAPTPNLEKIAAEGVRFTRHYADSTCRPARLALLTGRESARVAQNPDFRGISPELVTLPEVLQSSGYSTHHIGKWHLGDTVRDAWPDRQGFDTWFGFLNQFQLKGPDANGLFTKRPTYTNPFLQGSDETLSVYPGHLEDILGQRVSEKIHKLAKDKHTPWFINYWTFAPHHPSVAADAYLKQFPATPEGKYRALLAQVDANIGRVIDALRETDQIDNTLIIVTSDNGGTNQMMNNNFPFAGVKGGFEEGSLRTPLIIRWPNKRHAGEARDAVVAIQDIYPTVLGLVGIQPATVIEGQDLQLVLDDLPRTPRVLVNEIVVPGNFSYGLLSEDGNWRLTTDALYDLHQSPAGDNNVANKFSETRTRMQDYFEAWRAQKIRVPLQVSSLAPQSPRQLTGDSFRRSPGYGAFSVAIGVQWPLPDTTSILSHPSVWSLSTDKKGALQLSINNIHARTAVLSAGIARTGECVPLVMTSYFSRSRLHESKNSARVRLYIGNKRVMDERIHNPDEFDANLLAATIIGLPEHKGHSGIPVMFNAELPSEGENVWGEYSVEQAGEEVCASRGNLPVNQAGGSTR